MFIPWVVHAAFVVVCGCVRAQDERVRVCTEVLQGIRVVKMQAWEVPLIDRIRIARSIELSKLGNDAQVCCLHYPKPVALIHSSFEKSLEG